ncbi:MAG: VWA domain-containing protein, partial [Gammaproteobacteria bacterium]
GHLPDVKILDWPLLQERLILIEKLKLSTLPQYCSNQASRTDQVLLDILGWLDDEDHDFIHHEDNTNTDTNDAEDESALLEDQTQGINNAPPRSKLDYDKPTLECDDSDRELSLDDFDWQQQADRLHELDDLMKDYTVMRKLGSDLSRGLLARSEWRDILSLHKDIKHSHYLKNIISLIGRNTSITSAENGDVEHSYKSRLKANKQKHLHFSQHAPVEASGITRSDDIGRMLAVELSALGHSTLKSLWHVKRAERMLLSYQYEGVLSEHLPSFETEYLTPDKSGKRPLNGSGPIIIALDTSASMEGNPETLAKAIVLEVMRVAVREGRACLLLAFSGPDQIHQYELSNTEQGWQAILDAISLSFHGGTDISTVIEHACGLVEQESWNSADLLLISDSRFYVSDELINDVAAIKKDHGMRIHGINVSSWNSQAMEQLCQPVYRIAKFYETEIHMK